MVEVTGMLVVMGTELVTRMLVVAGIEVVEATELVVIVEVLIEERATPHASEVFLLSLFDVSYAVRDK